MKETVKCPQCGHENAMTARHCTQCGAPIPKELIDEAYDRTVYGKIDWLLELKSILTLKVITESPIFRIVILLGILRLGLISMRKNGTRFKVLPSDQYEVEYNEKYDEFYLDTDLDVITVNMYVPGDPEQIILRSIEPDGSVAQEEAFSNVSGITMQADGDLLYQVEAVYEDRSDFLSFFVY